MASRSARPVRTEPRRRRKAPVTNGCGKKEKPMVDIQRYRLYLGFIDLLLAELGYRAIGTAL